MAKGEKKTFNLPGETKLSPNFSLREFTKSQTATRRGIDNNPTQEHFNNMVALSKNILERVRAEMTIRYPGKGLFISSGYRSEALNEAIQGSDKSQHCKGQAADIDGDFNGINNAEIFDFIKNKLDDPETGFDQLIWEFGDENTPAWVHVSHRSDGKNRGRVTIATGKKTGKGANYTHIVKGRSFE